MADQPNPRRVLDLCDETLQHAEAERDAFLRRACAGDARLRASVDSVLLAISSAGEFLEISDKPGADQAPWLGRRIGNFTLREELGQGGMGSVYLAAREDGEFEQRVAVKLVHGYLLAGELVARFNAERQILATLNHPYIARLIDGGTTEDGIPYLVMEFVEGSPIDRYCDDNSLTVGQRVRLIRKVALAVDAAHRNLVVHRDLKPSNILVTADEIPKLLDFGIAKLIGPQAAAGMDHTVVFGHVAITPDYASPEQIIENTVTTVSDVYSLGVLTYELLAGVRPYHVETGSHRALLEAFESLSVPRPSTRLESIAPDLLEQIARHRCTSAGKLGKALRGDLDNILLKALQQDPARRYRSVAAFSADLENYITGLPVTARADNVAYRMGKFLRRNWLVAGASAVVLLSLVIGLAVALQQKDIARREADRASTVTGFLEDVLMAPSAVAGAPIASGKSASVADLVNLAAGRVETAFPGQPEIQAQLYATLAQANRGLGQWDQALALSEKALRLLDQVSDRSEVQATVRLAYALIQFHAPVGDMQRVRPALIAAERYAARNPGVPSKVHAEVLQILGQTEPGALSMEQMMQAAGQEWLAAGGSANDELLGTVHYKLGQIRAAQGRFDEAAAELRTAIDIYSRDGSRQIMELGFVHESMGVVMTRTGNYAAARQHLESAIGILEQSAERNPWLVVTHSYLSEVARLQGDLDGAQRALEEAQNIGRELNLESQAPHWLLLDTQWAELELVSGQFSRAIERLTARLEQVPANELVIMHRARARSLIALAHAGLGDRESANTEGNQAFREYSEYYGETESVRAFRARLAAAGIDLQP